MMGSPEPHTNGITGSDEGDASGFPAPSSKAAGASASFEPPTNATEAETQAQAEAQTETETELMATDSNHSSGFKSDTPRKRKHIFRKHANGTLSSNGNGNLRSNATDDDEERENDDDDDPYDIDALLSAATVIEDRWTPQPLWSIAPNRPNDDDDKDPLLTSTECYLGLVDFFRQPMPMQMPMPKSAGIRGRGEMTMETTTEMEMTMTTEPVRNATQLLAVATESSSHLSGRLSLDAQPWVYAGGGLGNVDECLSLNSEPEDPLVHVCLAGGTSRDSLTFASACVVSACSARDVLANDFVERVRTAGFRAAKANPEDALFGELLDEYVTLHRRIAAVGKYLGTGWVCGEYAVDWEPVPAAIWCLVVGLCAVLTLVETCGPRGRGRRRHRMTTTTTEGGWKAASSSSSAGTNPFRDIEQERNDNDNDTNDNDDASGDGSSSCSSSTSPMMLSTSSSSSDSSSSSFDDGRPAAPILRKKSRCGWSRWLRWLCDDRFRSAWDARAHLGRLTHRQSSATACLDGLRVGSILWVIGAHIMAIQSSTGAGYLNPQNFLPPEGFTTTLWGQLLFSSRYAVDTFLCVSGYLAAYVLQRKLPATNHRGNSNNNNSHNKNNNKSALVGVLRIVAVIFFRILRILPLYVCCLGFWMFLAPHMGHGPFWYQWEHFLEPCKQLWWTNLLFVNNFLPWGAPTEANCFYHSWYLAVDVQLFCLFAPWLVLLYQRSRSAARHLTVALWLVSVVGTAALAYTQGWSVNSFDGISVALFDVEGYAKPHVRAQSYLAGMFVALWPRRRSRSQSRGGPSAAASMSSSPSLSWKNNRDAGMVLALCGLAILSFATVTGAYSRRACLFNESPLQGHDCGSLWSPATNFVYTAFSRAAWSVCIALLLHLCLGDDQNGDGDNGDENDQAVTQETWSVTGLVRGILSWSIWTPLAHLSFGAYLIHPIVIYLWFLQGREKIVFRLSTYLMELVSITVVTFALSFVATLLVEFPFGILLRPPSGKRRGPNTKGGGQQQRQRQRQQRGGGFRQESRPHGDTELASLLVVRSSSSAMRPPSSSRSYGAVGAER